jgi:hypothetical protein
MISLSIISGTNSDLPKVCKRSFVVAEPRLVLAYFGFTLYSVAFLFLARNDTQMATVGVHVSIWSTLQHTTHHIASYPVSKPVFLRVLHDVCPLASEDPKTFFLPPSSSSNLHILSSSRPHFNLNKYLPPSCGSTVL